MRLDIGVVCAEQFLGALDGQPLGLVHDFAATVIALAGQPLGVFVGHDVGHRLGNGGADVVLGGDQLDALELAVLFAADDLGDLRVGGFEVVHIHDLLPSYALVIECPSTRAIWSGAMRANGEKRRVVTRRIVVDCSISSRATSAIITIEPSSVMARATAGRPYDALGKAL